MGTRCIINQKGLVKKIYFPREILPISIVTRNFVNMLLSFIIVFAAIIFSGIRINPAALLMLLPVMLIEYFLALGITMFSAAITVYFRDMEYIMTIIMMAWMYFSPVVYSIDFVPEKYMNIYMLNPMSPLIVAYRDILFSKILLLKLNVLAQLNQT